MKKLKKRLYRIIAGFAVLLIAILFPVESVFNISTENAENITLCIFLLAYFIVGGDVVKEAAGNIVRGQVFDENFLMTVATIGAFLVSENTEAVAVMLFYQVGELFQSYAVNKSRKSISELMDIRPDYANVVDEAGNVETKDPYDVVIGDIILVKPGEKIPLDGIIVKGSASIDTSALTGESVLNDVGEGDNVISGSVNKNGLIEIKVEKGFEESTVSKILNLVENASDKKAKTEDFIKKFAKYYTPIVCILALVIAIVPPLILSDEFSGWVYRALTFLVISCPCALVISVPLSFFGGLGGASAQGVLIKGSNYLEALSKCETVVFDKTGTLTKGNFVVSKIYKNDNAEEEELIRYAMFGEYYSNHPIALSIKNYYNTKGKCSEDEIQALVKNAEVIEIPGHGTKVLLNGKIILAGNKKLMDLYGINSKEANEEGTVVYIAVENKYLGCIVIEDEIKDNSIISIRNLKKNGIKKTVMLTGDRKSIGKKVSDMLGLDECFAELLPEDKVNILEKCLEDKQKDTTLAYVGDGINDAPVLARADIGIAMGGLGSDAAIEAADIVLMDDNPDSINKALKVAKKTMIIVKQNIVFAIGVKVLVLLLAAANLTSMWWAVFADVGVAVIAILNALRALKIK